MPRQHIRWTPDTLSVLERLARSGTTLSELAKTLGRSEASVEAKLRALKLPVTR